MLNSFHLYFLKFILAVATATKCDPRNFYGYEATTAYNYIRSEGIPAGERLKALEDEIVAQEDSDLIVGGSGASLGQFPWQAGLIGDIYDSPGKLICGGSLISQTRVLTAAHCWNDGKTQVMRFTAVFASTMIFYGGLRIQTNQVYTHPEWQPSLLRNDVAIIYLPYPVQYTHLVSPISLPRNRFENLDGLVLTASGFGVSDPYLNQVTPRQTLQYQNFRVIPNNVCYNFFPTLVTGNNVCTSGAGGRDPCRGDSGGPLALIRSNQAILIGMVSFGTKLGCNTGFPTVYTRIDIFLDYISSHIY